MRVLEVARQFYPKVGGIESCVLSLSRGLATRGHHVEVVTLDRDLQTGRHLGAPEIVETLPVHRIGYFGSRRYPIAPSWLKYADGFDVLHVHAIDFFVDSAALATRLGVLDKPIVVTTHGGIFHTTALAAAKNFYWRHILPRSLASVSTVVAVSDADAALFASIVPPGKLETIPNGVDPTFALAWERSRIRARLVCVGRVSESKNITRVIELFAAVAPAFPDAELVIAGPDEDGHSETLRRGSSALGLESRVRFTGPLPTDELAALVASAHLLISAAPHEGFGITTVEAMSAGVPALVTRTGVHHEIVESGVNGWFWNGLPDAQSVATLREALLLPDARLDEMGIAARASTAPYDWKLATDKYERVLESAYRKSMG